MSTNCPEIAPEAAPGPARQRKTLSLADEIVELGERLAREENRNFSNYVETLILRDAGRIPGEKTAAQTEEAA